MMSEQEESRNKEESEVQGQKLVPEEDNADEWDTDLEADSR